MSANEQQQATNVEPTANSTTNENPTAANPKL
jgi:hypothetical protein